MSFATEQIARIETLLAENPGVNSVVVGNTTVPLKPGAQLKTIRLETTSNSGELQKSAAIPFDM